MANPTLIYLLGKTLQKTLGGLISAFSWADIEVSDYADMGTEMLANGNFADTSGWTLATGTTLSVASNIGTMGETAATVEYPKLIQTLATTIGGRYRFTATFLGTLSSGLSGTYPMLRAGTTSGGLEVASIYAVSFLTDQVMVLDFIATSTTTYVSLSHRSTTAASGSSLWRDASCKQVIGGDIRVSGVTTLLGDTYLGGITNSVKVATDGQITLSGSATVFDDLNFDPSSSGGPVVTLPDYVTINNVIHREFTSANNQICGDGEELPHSYKLSSPLYPHAHVFLKGGESAGTTGVTFTLYWELRQTTGTTSGSVALAATSAQLGTTAGANKFDIYPSTTIAGAAEMGGQLTLKLARTAGDAGDIVVITYGVHYEIDSLGSNTSTSKT